MVEITSPEKRKVIAARLTLIQAKHRGVLRPEDVVKDAKNPSSPLHGLFEWDVQKASYEHWLNTARVIIGKVRVEVIVEDRKLVVPKYVRDPAKSRDEQGYMEVLKIRTEEDLSRDLLQQELKRAITIMERVCNLADVLGVGKEAQVALKRMLMIQERLSA